MDFAQTPASIAHSTEDRTMRSIEEIKAVKNRRPFAPFFLHTADGRELRISHPDGVAWGPGSMPRTLMVGHDGGLELLDLTLVVSIRTPEPAAGQGT